MSGGAAHKPALSERMEAAAPFLTLVRREFVRMLRRTRPFVFLLLLVCTAGVIVAASYPPTGVTPVTMGNYNEEMVSSLVVTLFVAALLLIPAYGAASIQSERSRNTYDLLSLTLIRPSGVVLAKVISTLGYFCLLVVAVLPFLGVSFFLVGVDWQTIIQSGVVILTVAITCATVGVAVSAFCRGPVAAVLLGYFATGVAIGGYLIALAILVVPVAAGMNVSPSSWMEQAAILAIMTSPVVAIAMVLAQNVSEWSVLATVIGQGIVWSIAIRAATRRLRKPYEPPQPLELDGLPDPHERRDVGISARLVREPIKDNVNPVRVRELRWGSVIGGDRGLAVLGLVATLLLFLFFIIMGSIAPSNSRGGIESNNAQDMILMWVMISAIAGSLIATGIAAVSVTTETDSNTLDGLLMSGLGPATILRGKASAILRFSVRPLLIGGMVLVVLGSHIFTEMKTAVLLCSGVFTVGITVALCTAIGVWVSVRARSTGMALLSAFGLVGFTPVGLLFIHQLLYSWSRGLGIPEGYENEVLMLHPLTLFPAQMAPYVFDSESSDRLLIWFICSLFHLAGIALIYYLAERRFVRMATRDG